MKGFVEMSSSQAALIYGGRDERIAAIVREIGRFIGRIIQMLKKMGGEQKQQQNSAQYA